MFSSRVGSLSTWVQMTENKKKQKTKQLQTRPKEVTNLELMSIFNFVVKALISDH